MAILQMGQHSFLWLNLLMFICIEINFSAYLSVGATTRFYDFKVPEYVENKPYFVMFGFQHQLILSHDALNELIYFIACVHYELVARCS